MHNAQVPSFLFTLDVLIFSSMRPYEIDSALFRYSREQDLLFPS